MTATPRLRAHPETHDGDLHMNMSDQDIIDFFDLHFDVTIAELAQMSGKSVAYIKRLLMGG